MNPIDDYFLIKRDDLHCRCSNIVKTPNTNFLKTKGFLVHVYGKVRRGHYYDECVAKGTNTAKCSLRRPPEFHNLEVK